MALRSVTGHPKFAHFKALIGKNKSETLGYLEALWHFTGGYAPQGNIGKHTDAAIESWLEWDGAPGRLIQALCDSRWLEPSEEHRLLVHDWHEHADQTTKKQLGRKGLEIYRHCPDISRQQLLVVQTSIAPCLDGQGQGQGQGQVRIDTPPPSDVVDQSPKRPVASLTVKDGSTFDLEAWVERVCALHPKPSKKGVIRDLGAGIMCRIGGQKMLDLEICLAAWCRSEQWTDKGGRFAKQLADWLASDGWEKWPADVPKPSTEPQEPAAKWVPLYRQPGFVLDELSDPL